MNALLSISQAAAMLGVCINTLRNWDKLGYLKPVYRTEGGHRRYDIKKLPIQQANVKPHIDRTIAYARVSSHDQKADLIR